jgi:hypothetical protein
LEENIKQASPRVLALAALFVCESLLLELKGRGRVEMNDLRGLMNDAARALSGVCGSAGEDFRLAGEIIEVLLEKFGNVPDPANPPGADR